MSVLRILRNLAVLVILAVAILGAPRSAVAKKQQAACFRVSYLICAHYCGNYVCKEVFVGDGVVYYCCPPTK